MQLSNIADTAFIMTIAHMYPDEIRKLKGVLAKACRHVLTTTLQQFKVEPLQKQVTILVGQFIFTINKCIHKKYRYTIV